MQQTALFTLPPAIDAARHPESPEWRTAWIKAGIGTVSDWNQMRVVAVKELLWIIAGSPTANHWLESNIDAIAGVVADTAGAAVPLVLRQRAVGVRASSDRISCYRLPRLVVAKQEDDWKPHLAPDVAPDVLARTLRKVERDLRAELATWGRLPPVLDNATPFLMIHQPGRAVPISAIRAASSGHGRPVSVLARCHMTLLSNWRIEGDLFVGHLKSLGFGRILRTAAPEVLAPQTQLQLLELSAPDQEATEC